MKHFTLTITLLLFCSAASAQEMCTAPSPDHLFVPEGGSMFTAATGIPYVGIGEYAYGVSSKTTVGFIYGQTPLVEGYGLRIRTIIGEPSERVRIYFRAPIFYYPQTHDLGGEPWFLAWPVVNIEYRRDCGRREWIGLGAVGAVCAHSLGTTLGLEHRREMMGEGFNGGIWNTIQAGISQPFSEHVVAQLEAGLVMNGFSIARKGEWVGGPPVILIMGVSYAM